MATCLCRYSAKKLFACRQKFWWLFLTKSNTIAKDIFCHIIHTVQTDYVVIFLPFNMDKYVYTLCILAKDCTCEKGQKVAYPDPLEEQAILLCTQRSLTVTSCHFNIANDFVLLMIGVFLLWQTLFDNELWSFCIVQWFVYLISTALQHWEELSVLHRV